MLLFLALMSADLVNQPRSFEGTVPVKLNYLLTLPSEYEQAADKAFPLVLFLHGYGGSGEDLELVKVHGPPKLVEAGEQRGFILVAPQTTLGRWWQPVELLALLDEIERTHRVDGDRIYITGLSMGGYGTWNTAGLAPERFAAAAPICGGGNGVLTRHTGTLPIWAFHGSNDTAVPVALSQHLVDGVNRNGGNAKLTIYDGVGHDSWTQTYADPKFWDWLLSQNRASRMTTTNQNTDQNANP